MNKPLVIVERRGAVGILTLKNPARRNVLSRAMLVAIRDGLIGLLRSPETSGATGSASAEPVRRGPQSLSLSNADVRCIVLRAAGPAFSAGHDLREIVEASPEERESLFALCTEVMEAVRNALVPVIAQVQGIATAAGCQLVASCDLVVASREASFATPGVKIGLFCSTPAVALSRAVAPKKAMEMLLTGQPIPAVEAERIGLVNRVVPAERLEEETLALATQIADASGYTLGLGKRAFYEQLALDRSRAYELAQKAMVENAAADDAREGMLAFLEKRQPRWRD